MVRGASGGVHTLGFVCARPHQQESRRLHGIRQIAGVQRGAPTNKRRMKSGWQFIPPFGFGSSYRDSKAKR